MSEVLRIIDETFKGMLYKTTFNGNVFFSKEEKPDIERDILNRLLYKFNTVLESEDYDWRLDLNSAIFLSFVHEIFEDNSERWSRMDRNYYLSTLIHESGLVSMWSEETEGYDKKPDHLDVIYWNTISSVELVQEDDSNFTFRFYFKDEARQFELFSNRFGTYDESTCLILRDFLNEIIESKNETEISLIEEHKAIKTEIEELITNENYIGALKELEIFKDTYDVEDISNGNTSFYHYNKTSVLIEIEQYEDALKTIENYIEKSLEQDEICPFANELKSEILIKTDKLLPAINCLALSEENYTNEDFKRSAMSLKETTYSKLKEVFLDVPYSERKLIFIGENIYSTNSNELIILKKNSLPLNISFPIGHPHVNEVYTCHPHKQHFYLPLKNYSEELFHDRISEFSWLLQCLGAVKLEISSSKSEFSNHTRNSTKDIDTNIDYKVSNAKLKFKEDNNENTISDGSINIAKTQMFKPFKSPHVPSDLVWYNSDSSWQRLAHQRLNGSIIMHNETITSSQSENVSNYELKQVDAELKLLLPKIGVKYKSEDKVSRSTLNKYEFVVHVEFEDRDKLIQLEQNYKEDSSEILNSTNEEYNLRMEKYKEDVMFMLEDDGIIDENERSILNRKMKKYGLTEEDVRLIENELTMTNYSENEIKYIEELKELLEDGEINDLERKILDRYAKKFNVPADIQKNIDAVFII